MAKEREIPCKSYVCAGENCLSGRKDVFHNGQCVVVKLFCNTCG